MINVAVVLLYSWFLAMLPRTVVGSPISYNKEGDAKTYIPLIVVFLSIFLVAALFLAIKLSYMKHRRVRAIRSLRAIRSAPQNRGFSSSAYLLSPQSRERREAERARAAAYRPFLVGCFGSPSWEARVKSNPDKKAPQKYSFMYRLHRTSRTQSSRTACSAYKQNTSSSRITRSTSFFSISSDLSFDDELTKALWPESPRMLTYPGERFGNPVRLVPRARSFSDGRRSFVGDFGEVTRITQGSKSRAGYLPRRPSVKLVDPSNSRKASYSFLSGLPPKSPLTSPFVGARDSLQLSRHHSRCSRKPVPPLPPLPSLPSYQPLIILGSRDGGSFSTGQYLPPLRFSPPTGVTSVFNADQPLVSVVRNRASPTIGFLPPTSIIAETLAFVAPKPAGTQDTATLYSPPQGTPLVYAVEKMNRPTKHNRSRSRTGLIPGASPLRSTFSLENVVELASADGDKEDTKATALVCKSSISSHGSNIASSSQSRNMAVQKQPGRSPESNGGYLRELTPLSDTSTPNLFHTLEKSPCDQSSVLTPKSDRTGEVDIGMLGLDRFHWEDSGEDKKVRPCHTRSDSLALVSFWEDGEWAREQEQRTDVTR
ncbi:hypothetical protein F5I97DRAFT_1929518 [Phlebopus sp. FC_14]|nr:hypothetical protein F5I97DRAFT_1929518 [Phlebopus sp. FC_14]